MLLHSVPGPHSYTSMNLIFDILSTATIVLNGTLFYHTIRITHQTVINLFLSSLFALNIFNAVINLIARSLISDDPSHPDFSDSGDLTTLSSYPCALKYFGYFFHRNLSIFLLTGTVAIRYFMVIKGDEIRAEDSDLRPHQASLKRISHIILVAIANSIFSCICINAVMPGFPFELLAVKICVGDMKRSTEERD